MSLPKLAQPKYTKKLPSGKTVVYTSYTGKEEKILLMANESNDPKQKLEAVHDVLETCTFGKVDLKSLENIDMEYLLILIKSKSSGEKLELLTNCKKCKTENEFEVSLEDITVTKKEEVSNKIEVGETSEGVKIFIELTEPKMFDDYSGEGDEYIKIIRNSIKSIYDSEGSVFDIREETDENIQDWLESISTDIRVKIKNYFDSLPTILYESEIVCSSCQHKNKIRIEGIGNFFF